MNRGLLVAVACLSGCQMAGRPSIAAQTPPVCLASYRIDHTDVTDDSDILFIMRDHTVYRNHLPSPCYGLRTDTRGFTYTATDPGSDTICSNLVTIRSNTTHNFCMLGAFEQISAQPPR